MPSTSVLMTAANVGRQVGPPAYNFLHDRAAPALAERTGIGVGVVRAALFLAAGYAAWRVVRLASRVVA